MEMRMSWLLWVQIICAVITVIALILAAVWNVQALITLRRVHRDLADLRASRS
jgi:flagellar biogenesis protein FliO